MYDKTITVFNYHKKSGKWFPTVISNVNLLVNDSRSLTSNGINNANSTEIIVNCLPDKTINRKKYLSPKQFAKCDEPDRYITFTPESDFFYDGAWEDNGDIVDDDYDEGFYHAMNDEYDEVHMITYATFFSLLPHFEIGGK